MAIGLICTLNWGCEKFLDETPNKRLAVAATLQDYQALLDQYYNINTLDAAAGEVSSDDYYVTDADWAKQSETDRRMYVWEKDNIFPAQINDWYYTYTPVYRCNTVLDGIDEVAVNSKTIVEKNNIKGQAYFLRARSFLNAVLIWAKAYHPQTAATDLGIPLKLSPNFNEISVRASIAASYGRIIADLESGIPLLPNTPSHVMRASKPAAYALMARTYLAMNDYARAGLYADSCLKLKGDLIDYNTLTASAAYPLTQFNKEVLFSATMSTPNILTSTYARVVPSLYDSYANNDLRKVIFFRKNTDGSYAYKGSYDGSFSQFTGIATNEVYLMRAECAARVGKVTEALADLNLLLRNRYAKPFVNVVQTEKELLIAQILTERRKELLFRGLRWLDLKRLNQLGHGVSLSRTVNGNAYTLPANSARFTLTIPESVIAISGMTQNP